jgi:N-acetylglucosaminyl-diphospho-decaprenol L-rhamnosyltransferase
MQSVSAFISHRSSLRNMRLLIVIVNYRTASLVIDCLRSLADQVAAIENCRVMITDNASGDDSVQRLRLAIEQNGWGRWAQVQPLENNGGFAAGNNAAIRPALASADAPRFVLLLNPDTVAHPGAIAALLQFMEANPHVGIAGARLENPDGTPQPSACRFHGLLSELESGLRLGVASKLMSRSRRRWIGFRAPA